MSLNIICVIKLPLVSMSDVRDAASRFLDSRKQRAAEQEVSVVVGAEHAFKAVHSELLGGHLGDGGVADERIDPGRFLQDLRRRLPHGNRIRRGESGLATWLKQAIAAGVLDIADAATASRQFIALILEFALWPQLIAGEKTPNHAQRRKIIASAVKLFLDGVRK